MRNELSEREVKHLEWMASGWSLDMIASTAQIPLGYVKMVRQNIFKKIKASNAPHAVAIAIKNSMEAVAFAIRNKIIL